VKSLNRREQYRHGLILCLVIAGAHCRSAHADVNHNTVRFAVTGHGVNFGTFDVELFTPDAPLAVSNFLKYVSDGGYSNTFFHQLAGSSTLVGGAYSYNASTNAVSSVPTDSPLINEYSSTRSNIRGTIALDKPVAGSNAATSQFFINLADNSGVYDTLNGGYTVFGQVVNNGMTVVDSLAGTGPNTNHVASWNIGGNFTQIPLVNYPGTGNSALYLETVTSATVLSSGQHSWAGTTNAWSTNTNWSLKVVPSGTDSKAIFGATAGGTVDLGTTPQTINTLAFSSASIIGPYSITAGTAGILTLNGGTGSATVQIDSTNSVAQTISAPLAFATNTTINNQSAGAVPVVLAGVQYWGAKTVTIAAGNVKYLGATSGSATAGSATLNIANGAGVEFAGSANATAAVIVTNNGYINVSGAGQSNRKLAGTGDTLIAAGATLVVGTRTAGTLTANTGAIAQASLTVNGTLRNDGNTTLSATFSPAGAGAVNLDSPASQALSIGAAGIAKLGNVTLINATGGISVADGGQLTAGTITAQANGTIAVGKNASVSVARITLGGDLSLAGSATQAAGKLSVATSGTSPVGTTLASRVGSLTLANDGTAAPNYFATLDLANNDLIINSGKTSLTAVMNMIRSGQANSWTGTGLTSSIAAGNAFGQLGKTALGVIRNDSLPNNPTVDSPLYTSFGGVTGLAGNEILVKYTYYGDLDLDGKISPFDSALMDAGLAGVTQDDGRPGWFFGDLNYDGTVNATDLALFNAGRGYYDGSGSYGTLPEPSAWVLALFGIVAAGLGLRLRRI